MSWSWDCFCSLSSSSNRCILELRDFCCCRLHQLNKLHSLHACYGTNSFSCGNFVWSWLPHCPITGNNLCHSNYLTNHLHRINHYILDSIWWHSFFDSESGLRLNRRWLILSQKNNVRYNYLSITCSIVLYQETQRINSDLHNFGRRIFLVFGCFRIPIDHDRHKSKSRFCRQPQWKWERLRWILYIRHWDACYRLLFRR